MIIITEIPRLSERLSVQKIYIGFIYIKVCCQENVSTSLKSRRLIKRRGSHELSILSTPIITGWNVTVPNIHFTLQHCDVYR